MRGRLRSLRSPGRWTETRRRAAPSARAAIAVRLDVVDEHRLIGCRPEALERDLVDLRLGLARADERGVDDDVEDLVDRQHSRATGPPTRARCSCRSPSCGRARGASACTRSSARLDAGARSSARRSRGARPPGRGRSLSCAAMRSRNASSVMRPVSSSNSGLTPSLVATATIARRAPRTRFPSCRGTRRTSRAAGWSGRRRNR